MLNDPAEGASGQTPASEQQEGQQQQPGQQPPDAAEGRTPEEVAALWRNRVSQKDKAHAAAEKALREEIESLRKQVEDGQRQATRRSTGQSTNGEATNEELEALRRQYEDAQRQLELEKAGRVIDQRKAKYPALLKQGVSDAVFATADEADLAKLNVLAEDEGQGYIAPTGPRRTTPQQPKRLEEKSKDELLGDLKRASGPYEEFLRQQR